MCWKKNARDTPFTEKLAILIGFVRRTKKHITMHLLVGSNREATSASSAYVDGRIAWPNSQCMELLGSKAITSKKTTECLKIARRHYLLIVALNALVQR
jgi:hypothetical protein